MEPDDYEALFEYKDEPSIRNEPSFFSPTLWQEVERFFEYSPKVFVLYLSFGFISLVLPLIYPEFFSKAFGVMLIYLLTFGSIFGSLFFTVSDKVVKFRVNDKK